MTAALITNIVLSSVAFLTMTGLLAWGIAGSNRAHRFGPGASLRPGSLCAQPAPAKATVEGLAAAGRRGRGQVAHAELPQPKPSNRASAPHSV